MKQALRRTHPSRRARSAGPSRQFGYAMRSASERVRPPPLRTAGAPAYAPVPPRAGCRRVASIRTTSCEARRNGCVRLRFMKQALRRTHPSRRARSASSPRQGTRCAVTRAKRSASSGEGYARRSACCMKRRRAYPSPDDTRMAQGGRTPRPMTRARREADVPLARWHSHGARRAYPSPDDPRRAGVAKLAAQRSAHRTLRVAGHAHLAPAHRQRIDHREATGHRFADAGDELQRFGGLGGADDADEWRENAHRRAARLLELVAFAEQAVVAGRRRVAYVEN